jgi:hypothetical protein
MPRILRGNEIEIEGHYDLGSGQSGTKATAVEPSEAGSQVRVVENGPQYTVLEFVCSCGKTSLIRCEH